MVLYKIIPLDAIASIICPPFPVYKYISQRKGCCSRPGNNGSTLGALLAAEDTTNNYRRRRRGKGNEALTRRMRKSKYLWVKGLEASNRHDDG